MTDLHPGLVGTSGRVGTAGVDLLGGADGATAITTQTGSLTYAELRRRVARRRDELGGERRLMRVACANDVEPLVTYLAALAGGHPVLLVEGGDTHGAAANRAELDARFDPDVVFEGRDGRWVLEERRVGTRHDLHPELAMLASTSGSTGSPKLVRLSGGNLLANAASIADYLDISADDRAATSLPMHYCYGLSVINSHLLAGGSVHLTDRSVVDQDFWREFERVGATSFAGVPYTFELLDATGFAEHPPSTLRYVTQAGGRLAPDAVRRHAALGRRHGYDLVVMYGQTEATARMAYLPPELAERRAGTIGVPIPGGEFRIDASVGDRPGVGELVYAGPNVMLGYAEYPRDFALGREVEELRTGDLARRHPDGLYEIVGRANRFVKVFGLRIALDRVERLLGEAGIDARAVADDERLAVFVRADRLAERARRLLVDRLALPGHAVGVHAVDRFPATSSGKPDYRALAEHARMLRAEQRAASVGDDGTAASIRDLYAELLGRPDATADDSFVVLDGDSLSYVEVSVRLGDLLGGLPEGWPERTARELAASVPSPTQPTAETAVGAGVAAKARNGLRSKLQRAHTPLETSVLLRAAAILLIVATHADLIQVKGGAHLLLAVAGFNLARFRLAAPSRRGRTLGLLRAAATFAVPAVIWIGAVALVTRAYDPATALLVNGVSGPDGRWSEQWQFWFLEALFWSILAITAMLAVPWLDRLERARPFGFALGAVAVAVALRLAILGDVDATATERYAVATVAAFLAVGWLVARADTTRRRIVASVVAIAVTVGFFGDPVREAIIVVGCLLLAWVPTLPVPRLLRPAFVMLAASSLYVYLTHWQVYPPIEEVSPVLAIVASFAVGIAAWQVARVAGASWSRARARVARIRCSRAAPGAGTRTGPARRGRPG